MECLSLLSLGILLKMSLTHWITNTVVFLVRQMYRIATSERFKS